MIDIHSHILPGLDDGPKEIQGSLKIVEAASSSGTTAMVATPHALNGIYVNNRNEIIAAIAMLQDLLMTAGIPVTLYPGAETALTPEIFDSIDSGELMTINDNGKYLLSELPACFIREQIFEIVFQLKMRGITPIISHPERDGNILRNPDILVELIHRGCLMQSTARSISGGFGREIKDFSHLLLQNGLIHVISSDCHSETRRGPDLKTGLDQAADIIGTDIAEKMVLDFPRSIINGEDIEIPPFKGLTKKRNSRFWKRR